MEYVKRIEELAQKIKTEIGIDLLAERQRGRVPAQVSSDFLTNKEQGDWAEAIMLEILNKNLDKFKAFSYGRKDDIISGEPGFKEFFEKYQDELDKIGKCPDVLIFDNGTADKVQSIIQSDKPRNSIIEFAKKASAALEVRSSAFLESEYENFMQQRESKLKSEAILKIKDVLQNYGELLKGKDVELYDKLHKTTNDNIKNLIFRTPAWRNGSELELKELLKEINLIVRKLQQKDFASFTPKVEDLSVILKWIKVHGVKHYYVQVFFDKIYVISFEKILEILSNKSNDGNNYFIEEFEKNQFKKTIYLNIDEGECISKNVKIPEHKSNMKRLERGRLLFHVKFKASFIPEDVNKGVLEKVFNL